MPEPVAEIPNRPAFRAAEVCEIAQIPPYVLKSWEKEFPGLGTDAKPGGPRVYRRADVEQVMRIKQLLFAEGLTLAGARRRLEGEPKVEDEPLPELGVSDEVRSKVSRVKRELRSLLDMLTEGSPSGSTAGRPEPDGAAMDARPSGSAPADAAAAPPAAATTDTSSEKAQEPVQATWPPIADREPVVTTTEPERSVEEFTLGGAARPGAQSKPGKPRRAPRKAAGH